MRVMHLVASPTMTGPADPALALAASQRRYLSIDAAIACDHRRTGNMLEKARALGVPVVPGFSLSTKDGPVRAIRDRFTLRRLADEHDILHVHSSHDHALAVTARGPAVVIRSIHHPRAAMRRMGQRFAYRRTEGFIVLSREHRTGLLESYPEIEEQRVAVVRGAVDTDRFTPDADGWPMRQAHGIPQSAFVVGMVARFQEGRRQEVLVKAFSEARKKSSVDLWLVFVGKGETRAAIEARVQEAGISEVARFYGFRDQDLPEAIRSCDVTVLLKEGNDASCRAALESLASGVPVIGARVPAIEEMLEGQGCGLLVDGGSWEELERAILTVAQAEESARRTSAERARARALSAFTDRQRALAVGQFYDRILALPKTP